MASVLTQAFVDSVCVPVLFDDNSPTSSCPPDWIQGTSSHIRCVHPDGFSFTALIHLLPSPIVGCLVLGRDWLNSEHIACCRRKGCPADRTRPRWSGWWMGYKGGRRCWGFGGTRALFVPGNISRITQKLTLVVPKWDLLKWVCSVSLCARGLAQRWIYHVTKYKMV